MRTNMLPGLIEALKTNAARQQERVRLFEQGLTFVSSPEGIVQKRWLGGLLWGSRDSERWLDQTVDVDFFDAKGTVDLLLAWAGINDVSFERCDDPVLHPGQAAVLKRGDEEVGRIGRLHPEVEARLDISGVYVFELAMDAILSRPRRRYQGLSRYPSVRRDFSILINREVAAAALEGAVRGALDERLVDFKLFDVYEGEGIDSNEKSVAIGLTFQSQNETLTDDTVNALADQALQALMGGFDARLR